MDGQDADGEGVNGDDEEERDRRALVWFLVALLLVLFVLGGASALGVFSSGGTGELTVQVTDQNGQAASGQEVQILDPETGEVIATAITDEDGDAEFTLDQGEYDIVVGGSSKDVTLGDATTVDLSVNTAPPEPGETAPTATNAGRRLLLPSDLQTVRSAATALNRLPVWRPASPAP